MAKITLVINADKADLKTQYLTAIARLDVLINKASFTNAELAQAVRDEATMIKRMLKVLKVLIV